MIVGGSDEVYGDDPTRKAYNASKDFINQRQNKNLSPLRLNDISITEFSTELNSYSSVLTEGGSIAFGRGEYLTSIRLSKRVQTLFSTPIPCVTDGPPLTWTTIILFAGPNFEGPSQFIIGESSVDLSEDDFELLCSGRPWRFLSPWPDKDDCRKELMASESVLQELTDARRIIDEVSAKISRVEQHLMNHHSAVFQLSEEQTRTCDKEIDSAIGGTQESTPEGVLTTEAPGNQRASLGALRYSDITQNAQPLVEDSDTSADAISRNDVQPEDSASVNDSGQKFRLHISPFLQTLSEILEDPKHKKALSWSEDGQSVFVALESHFPVHLLTRLSTKTYQSFVRRLYYFGFHKVDGAYRHDSFIRGQPSSIQPTRRMSHGPSIPSSLSPSTTRKGPRYKVIKRKRIRESV